MNSEQRKRLRQHLIELGFDRQSYSQDHGDGKYTEVWWNTPDAVILSWGPRGESAVTPEADITPGSEEAE